LKEGENIIRGEGDRGLKGEFRHHKGTPLQREAGWVGRRIRKSCAGKGEEVGVVKKIFIERGEGQVILITFWNYYRGKI